MDTRQVFPVQLPWRIALLTGPVLGAIALVLGGAELLGLAERGALLGEASDGERWAGVIVGALLQAFGVSALRHARLTIDDTHLRYLGFGVACQSRSLAFADVRRWGHAVGSNRGRREPLLLFELRDGTRRLIKLAMYTRQDAVKDALRARLGPEAPASATMTGAVFDEG